jgi:carboxyl-terminal processing protease
LAVFFLFLFAGCGGGTGSVGAVLGKDVHTGRLFVRDVPPGMASAIAGIREGDEVLAIDGIPVGELSPQEVHLRLEGKVGTKVVLLVVRGGVTQRIEVLRGARVSE